MTLPELEDAPADIRQAAAQGEDALLALLTDETNRKFGPAVEAANSPAELEKLAKQIRLLSESEQFRGNPQVFDPLLDQISERSNAMNADALNKRIDTAATALTGAGDIMAVLQIDRELSTIAADRRKLLIKDPAVRTAMDGAITELQQKRQATFESFRAELDSTLERRFQLVQELIARTSTEGELKILPSEAAYQDLVSLVDTLREKDLRDSWREKLRTSLSAREQEIRETREAELEEERFVIAERLEDSQELLAEISQAAGEIGDVAELKRWTRRNALITRYNSLLLGLPESLRREGEEQLSRMLDARENDLAQKRRIKSNGEAGFVTFGGVKAEIFRPLEVVWRPEVVAPADGASTGALLFKDNVGRVFKPECEPVPLDINAEATRAAIAAHRAAASRFFEVAERKVPAFNPRWALNDFNNPILGKMARLTNSQLKRGEGILILEGEAGTGKNVLWDIFCHYTNREMLTFGCNDQSEKEDFTYRFGYDPVRGTFREDSDLVRALQTPGMVINFDEINTLRPGLLKMFNRLLDSSRTLLLSDGRQVKMHPSVIIAASMNPQSYLGTKKLSLEVKSRARILAVGYPSEKRKDSSYAPYEAEMMMFYHDAFKGVAQSEFYTMWDHVINRRTDNGGDRLITPEREALIRSFAHAIKIANRLREAYFAYQTDPSAASLDFVYSLRESMAVAFDLTSEELAGLQPDALGRKTAEIVKDVVLPKVSAADEKARAEAVIDNV